jgi:hypothetical protein
VGHVVRNEVALAEQVGLLATELVLGVPEAPVSAAHMFLLYLPLEERHGAREVEEGSQIPE